MFNSYEHLATQNLRPRTLARERDQDSNSKQGLTDIQLNLTYEVLLQNVNIYLLLLITDVLLYSLIECERFGEFMPWGLVKICRDVSLSRK